MLFIFWYLILIFSVLNLCLTQYPSEGNIDNDEINTTFNPPLESTDIDIDTLNTTLNPPDDPIMIDNCNEICVLKYACSTENSCSEYCTNKDPNEHSLTFFTAGCNIFLMQLQLTTYKVVDLYSNHYKTLGPYWLIYASNDQLEWIQGTTLYGIDYDQVQPQRQLKSNKYIVDYDICGKNLYYIDSANRLKMVPSEGAGIFINNFTFPKTVVAACIDFQKRELYSTERNGNNYTVKKLKINDSNFQNIATFLDDFSGNVSMKINIQNNMLFVSIGGKILMINVKDSNIKNILDFKCKEIKSFDFDTQYIYVTCEESGIIRKLNYETLGPILNVANLSFNDAPLIVLTRTVSCPEATKEENSPAWIPLVGGIVGGGILLLCIILSLFLCFYCKKKFENNKVKSPALPPSFKSLQLPENIYEEDPYTEIEVYETTPSIDGKNLDVKSDTVYIQVIDDINRPKEETVEETERNIYSNKCFASNGDETDTINKIGLD